MQTDCYCNNCGKGGHLYHQCKMPITSIGAIVYRKIPPPPGLDISNSETGSADITKGIDHPIQYLMIRRKDSLGYIDFMRGKYNINNEGKYNICGELT